MKLRYFDHNATTPLAPAARQAWLDAAQNQWLNPSSPYRAAAAVRVHLEAARESLAMRFDVEPHRVVFTSGATEANNVVMRHWAASLPAGARVGINPTEHPSVIEPSKVYLGERVFWLPVNQDGVVEVDRLSELVSSGQLAAVSAMAANNETGVIQPWQEIAEICQRAQIPYHCDASQWVGKMPMGGLSACSYVTACAHKFGGPKGVGFMLLPSAGDTFCLLLGGAQESAHRAVSEDIASVRAMLAALDDTTSADAMLRDTFIENILAAIPASSVVGAGAPRLWNTVSIIMPQHKSVRWIRALEKAGFLLSAGSACSTGRETASSVLQAMGIDTVKASRVLRISAGGETNADDWQALVAAMTAAYDDLNQEATVSKSTVISID